MSKYQKLWQFIKENGKDSVTLSFDEIEKILSFPIDHSFLTYKKELFDFGYKTGKISQKNKTVIFEKIASES